MSRTLLDADDHWFRPYFLVDAHLRVSGWPEATALTLEIPAECALGRPCWDVIGTDGCKRRCGDCGGAAPDERTCSRLPLLPGQDGWIVWADPGHITRGTAGREVLEALLVCGALGQASDWPDLDATLDAIRRACGADDCELFLLEAQHGDVVLRGCAGADRDAFLQQTRMPLGYGYPGTVTLTNQPLCTDHVQDDDRFRRDAVKRRGIQTVIGVPVLDGGRPLGYLGVGWKRTSIPLDWGLRLLQAMQPLVLDAARRSLEVGTTALPPCALRCFGPLEFGHNERRGSQDAFERRKSLDLLRHLLLARGAPLPRDTLIELLWPEAPWAAGGNRLHVTLNALRNGLAAVLPGSGGDLVKQRHGHYRLDIAALGPIDAFMFADGVDAARKHLRSGDIGGAISRLEEVLPLYRGELFADADDVAFETPRQHFRLRYRESLSLLVDLYLRQDRIEAAMAALADARERADEESDLYESLLHELRTRHRDGVMAIPTRGARRPD
ncbi:MAG: GAF domain-containing protein [Pseudomonadales bacterium]|nr:GAF domain-containing protein [Pseudomonadales bacterium]